MQHLLRETKKNSVFLIAAWEYPSPVDSFAFHLPHWFHFQAKGTFQIGYKICRFGCGCGHLWFSIFFAVVVFLFHLLFPVCLERNSCFCVIFSQIRRKSWKGKVNHIIPLKSEVSCNCWSTSEKRCDCLMGKFFLSFSCYIAYKSKSRSIYCTTMQCKCI